MIRSMPRPEGASPNIYLNESADPCTRYASCLPLHNFTMVSLSSTFKPTTSPAIKRLASIRDHMEGSTSTVFTSENVPQAPEDPLFGLMAAYRKDTFEKKVDLGIGAYRDNNAKPWVLPVVKKVWESISSHIRRVLTLCLRPTIGYAETQISTMNIFP